MNRISIAVRRHPRLRGHGDLHGSHLRRFSDRKWGAAAGLWGARDHLLHLETWIAGISWGYHGDIMGISGMKHRSSSVDQ